MLILTSILLFTFGVFSIATEDEFCKKGMDQCFVPDIDIDFPDSEESLNKICQVLVPRIKCMLDFKNKCSEKDWRPHFEILDTVNDLVEEVCDKDSKIHKELSLHLPCIQGVVMSHRNNNNNTCKPIVREALEEMTSDLDLDFEADYIFSGEDDRARYMCISEALAMSCFVASISVRCGEKAEGMVGSIMERVGFWEDSCPENILEEVKAAVAIVQPFMELEIAAEEILSQIK